MNSRVRITIGSLLLVVGLHLNTLADETPNDQSDRPRRIELVQRFASRHRIATAAKPDIAFQLRPKPLVYWTSPTRGDAFGGTFLWVRHDRPMAFGGMYLLFKKSGTELLREFHSLTSESITAHFEDDKIWAPKRGGVEFQVLPGAKPPAESRVARLRQIKAMASRFSVAISQPKTEPEPVRRLPTPIYRYSDADSGVTDGAIVAFVKGTDPEAMLLIEARSNAEAVRWHYAVARCTSWAVTVRLDEDVVYDVPYYDFSRSIVSAPFFIPEQRPVD